MMSQAEYDKIKSDIVSSLYHTITDKYMKKPQDVGKNTVKEFIKEYVDSMHDEKLVKMEHNRINGPDVLFKHFKADIIDDIEDALKGLYDSPGKLAKLLYDSLPSQLSKELILSFRPYPGHPTFK